MMGEHARECISRCRTLAMHTEEAGFITRTFLSAPMRDVHAQLDGWRDAAFVDGAGNWRAPYETGKPTFYIGSHLDTVPHAGAFDGILGVMLAIKLAELARPERFQIEVVGFSEEEGVRFGFPFIGSLAMMGELTPELLARTDSGGVSVASAIAGFGLDPREMRPVVSGLGFLEFHIEQGPVLESLGLPLGIVDAISGQTRFEIEFEGKAGHAGTTPMVLRQDALACAAEWMVEVEAYARSVEGLVATVGRIEAFPGAANVIPGRAKVTLDVRHIDDAVRRRAVDHLLLRAERRGLRVASKLLLEQAAVEMDARFNAYLADAVEQAGYKPHRMPSGAGHDAMIMARRMPAAMLFLRSPGGLSHHPDEAVLVDDVAAALVTGLKFLEALEKCA